MSIAHPSTQPPESGDESGDGQVAGWREWVTLSAGDASADWIKAKLDTGARTSAVHAFDITEETSADGVACVRFQVHPWQRSSEDAVEFVVPIHDRRTVRSSSGHVEDRYVVLMSMSLVGRRVEAEVTLSRRDEMGFRMLVGREALRQGFLVDPGRSYLGGRPKRRVRRKNRGV